MLKPKIERKSNIVTITCTTEMDAKQCKLGIEKALTNPLARAAMKAQAKKIMKQRSDTK